MIVITYTFSAPPGFEQMAASVAKQGYEIANIRCSDNPTDVMREIYKCMKRAQGGHDQYIYADAADTFFQRQVNVPSGYLLYSTEKQCFPYPELAPQFKSKSRWRYLNNGVHAGPLALAIEFWEKYDLWDIGAKNGQHAVQEAYLDAIAKKFPIKLDTGCKEFQSIAFESEDEFSIKDGLVYNNITKTTPAILHGNGVTPMGWVYKGDRG